MRIITFVLCSLIAFHVYSDQKLNVLVKDDIVTLVIDENENTITLKKLELVTELPSGIISHSMKNHYILPISTIERLKDGVIKVHANDVIEAQGIDIKITIMGMGPKSGFAVINIQDEEIGLFYNPQLMDVTTRK